MAGKTFLKTALTISLFFVVFAVAGNVHAKIIYVDDDAPANFSNIQAAIDDANDGDIIIVNPGTYTGEGNRDIDYLGKAITVRSLNGPETCIINCEGTESQSHRGFYFHSGEGPDSVLSGLTITNGYAPKRQIGNYIRMLGGAIYCDYSSPVITNCIFRENISGWKGGAIMSSGSKPKIINCLFQNNVAQWGGGLHTSGVYGSSQGPIMTNCTFVDNFANNRFGGGGVYCDSTGKTTLTNCILWGNTFQGGGGYGAQVHLPNPVVSYCYIEGSFGSAPLLAPDGYHLLAGSPCIDAGDPDYITAPDETDLDGKPRVIGGRIDIGAFEYQPRILYVDDDATGANDGSSWADAFNYLQDALTAAWSGDEIRVAQGIYKPDRGAVVTTGDREATFQLINDVTLKGGYAGTATPDPNARDIELYETILTGDLDGNDVDVNEPEDLLDEPTRAENSYHVVTGSGTDSTAILDRFTITSGNASAWNYNHKGGGMINEDGSPTVTNCRFTENFANGWGGGMCNTVYSYPTLTNCTFDRNSSREYGGGMLNFYSDPTLINCIFVGNSAGRDGGGGKGGGIHNDSGSPTLTNCVFSGNSAGYIGGGIYNENASAPILTNCTFSGNSGVAIFTEGCTTVTNCIFWGNTDNNGTGEPAQFGFYDDYSKININYSCVQGWTGGLGGTGNIGDNPLFVDLNNHDYHLLHGSPCIDAGDPNYIAGPNETDLEAKPRVMGGRIDMGAYESPIFAEARILPQTINLASKGNWITCYIWLPEEYDVVDIEPNSIFLEDEIQPEQFSVDEQKQVVTARFTREDVQPILQVGDINLKITGRLTDGTVFEATDMIKVIDKAGKN